MNYRQTEAWKTKKTFLVLKENRKAIIQYQIKILRRKNKDEV